ncbi:MAG: alpha/beta fold hydrolase [Actinomycetota bacterium]|nr:alpha/beta fold hydrolase [Actinomycetota bacterium]
MRTCVAATSDSTRSGAAKLLGALLVALLLAANAVWASPASAASVKTEDLRVASGSGADAVDLDVTLYLPDAATSSTPAPAIIVAHGFGGSKNSVDGVGKRLAETGYVALAYTARGFGDSTGTISVNAPEYEIADASRMIDLLAQRPEVVQDAAGDPRVGIYGRSYGGALGLLTAGYDDRVDAIAPGSTWSSLVSSLFPNDVGAPPAATPAADPAPGEDGVFKRLWAEMFFESGGGTVPDVGQDASAGDCGNYEAQFCEAFLEAATLGRLTPELRELLEASSPSSVLDRITAPTLLTQGEGDTLFPLSEADATARGIAANGTPVKMMWYSGGHGARTSRGDTRLQLEQIAVWFDYYLRDQGAEPAADFYYSAFEATSAGNAEPQVVIQQAAAYPGLTGGATPRTEIPLTGDPQQVRNPEGATPAALSALPPGLEVDEGRDRNSEQPSDIPDQIATFESQELESDTLIVGAPVVTLRVASPSSEAVLFGKLYDIAPDGEPTLLLGLVAPLRLTGLATTIDDAEPVTVTLPAVALTVPAGHRLQVGLASTDQVFTTPTEEQVYEVALADAVLSVPQVQGGEASGDSRADLVRIILIVGAVILVVTGIVAFLLMRRPTRSRLRRG